MRIKLNEGIQFQSNVSIAGTPTTPTQAIAQPQQVLNLIFTPSYSCKHCKISIIYLFLRHSIKFNKTTLKKNVASF